MSHLLHVKQMYRQPMHLVRELIQITRGRVDFDRYVFCVEKSLLAPSFKPLTLRPRFSSICSRTFLKGFCHFHFSVQTFNLTNDFGGNWIRQIWNNFETSLARSSCFELERCSRLTMSDSHKSFEPRKHFKMIKMEAAVPYCTVQPVYSNFKVLAA